MTPEDLDPIAKSLAAAKDYADCIMKPPLEQLGGLLADTVGNWRLKNRVNFLLKIKKYLEEQGVKPTKLLPEIFVPLIDEAGNTEDETLSEMFARLGAAHLDAERAGKVHPSFAKTVGQLSPLDVRLLRMIDTKDQLNFLERRKEHARKKAVGKKPDGQESSGKESEGQYLWNSISLAAAAQRQFSVSHEQAALSIANLSRLGLIRTIRLNERDFAGAVQHDLIISDYGEKLLSACNKPGYWRHPLEAKRDEFYSKMAEPIDWTKDAAGKWKIVKPNKPDTNADTTNAT